ncbi:MAG: chemotaxis-specific protein-glutamate methyltransferase CheB [Candidatus Hodarchaeales archaeon]
MQIKSKIMVVDDSAVFRRFISVIIKNSGMNLEVVASAPNGTVCLQKMAVPKFKPDLVLMDIMMPEMDGIEAISHIMDLYPTPVIIVSGMTKKDVDIALSEKGMAIFESGSVEYVKKPDHQLQGDQKRFERELIAKIESLSPVNLQEVYQGFNLESFMRDDERKDKIVKKSHKTVSIRHGDKIIIIGASTGGTRAVSLIISKLPVKSPPILVVQHMPEFMPALWAGRLQNLYRHLRIKIVREGEELMPNNIYVTPGKKHCIIEKGKKFKLVTGEKVNYVIPSIDVTFISAARIYKQNVLGIILTGMGKDGTNGANQIKKKGGKIFAEHESTCLVYSMPRNVIEANLVDKILPLHEIPSAILKSGWI